MLVRIRPSLQKRGHALSPAAEQCAVLDHLPLGGTFLDVLKAAHLPALARAATTVLQINLGKRCNQTCRHCHVDAGPDRKEVMNDNTVEACLALLERGGVSTLDITGGAPELHPRFREIVTRARALGCRVIDRCNLTITLLPNYAYLPRFFADNEVEVVASLPWYSTQVTDAQRGEGVFEQSIAALRRLNEVGYGQGDGLVLNLVTNPGGAFLPAPQEALQREWKREMSRRHGVTFDALYTITNMPVSRFLEFLVDSGNLEHYLRKLVDAFNPAAVEGLMCRSTLSVGWDGKLYDCDFNQMLEMERPEKLDGLDLASLQGTAVRVGQHCFGCTAGSGSSCGGSTAKVA